MSENSTVSEIAVWQSLETITDPEIPSVTLIDLGIVRDVSVAGSEVTVTIAPTFSGCPALETMKKDISREIQALGPFDVRIEIQLSPAWTSDWISERGRQRLKAFGLSPPRRHNGEVLLALEEDVQCPYCDAVSTVLKNNWGSTPCRMIYTCSACNQPFERFKPL